LRIRWRKQRARKIPAKGIPQETAKRYRFVTLKRQHIAIFKQEENYPHRFFTFEMGKWGILPLQTCQDETW